MFQMTPWVKTECSYRAMSLPSVSGVSRSARIVFDGRLPSKTRCGTSQSGVPSALTSFGRLAERQRLGLGEDVRQQHVVMPAKRIERLGERDEVARDEPRSLMNQLIERVLAVGSRLAPIDRAGIVVDLVAIERDVLAVALHRQLLQIGRKSLQVLLVGQHRNRLGAEEIVVPDGQQPMSTGRLRSNGAVRKCSSIW